MQLNSHEDIDCNTYWNLWRALEYINFTRGTNVPQQYDETSYSEIG
jgi:hypothetical protein